MAFTIRKGETRAEAKKRAEAKTPDRTMVPRRPGGKPTTVGRVTKGGRAEGRLEKSRRTIERIKPVRPAVKDPAAAKGFGRRLVDVFLGASVVPGLAAKGRTQEFVVPFGGIGAFGRISKVSKAIDPIRRAGFVKDIQIFKSPTGGRLTTSPRILPKDVKGVGVLQPLKKTTIFKTAFKTAALISGIDVLTVWFGADNRASTSSYYTNLVWDRYNDGEVTQAEALSRLSELETTHKQAKDFIDYSTFINPVLWFAREFYMQGMDEQEVNMAENRRLVTETEETTSAKFERLAEEKVTAEAEDQRQFEENQELILEARLASEERFAEAQSERDSNKMAWAKETALFYEALRKRNAGIPLTEEEEELLWSWGIDPRATLADWDAYGQSNLNFGLIG